MNSRSSAAGAWTFGSLGRASYEQVSRSETEKLLAVAWECLSLEGDFVEFGCYDGERSLLLAEVLHKFSTGGKNVTDATSSADEKKLWVYDSFEGLPGKSEWDDSIVGESFQAGELMVSKRSFKLRFLRANLPLPIIVKGWFRNVSSEEMPEKIAFAFIDGDFYESTRDALLLVGPRMVEGGMILVHDYNNPALPGVSRAMEEWAEPRGLEFEVYDTMAIMKWGNKNE